MAGERARIAQFNRARAFAIFFFGDRREGFVLLDLGHVRSTEEADARIVGAASLFPEKAPLLDRVAR